MSHSFNRRTGLEWLFQPAVQHLRLFKAIVPSFAQAEGKRWALFSKLVAAYAAQCLARVVLFTAVMLGLLASIAPTGL